MPTNIHGQNKTEFRYLGPSTLYKYMKFRDSFFDEPVLRFSPLDELNDPFELSPACFDFLDSTRQKLRDSYPEPLGPSAERIILAKCFDDVAVNVTALKDYGILSLAEDPEHILMWSHYADQHRGMAVGFDLSHEFFKQMFISGIEFALPVKYCNQRPLYSMKKGDCLAGVEGFLGTKGSQWVYEREWRIATNSFSKKKVVNGIGGFIDIPNECIKDIFLGLRRSQTMIDRARKFIADNPHVRLFLGYKAVGAYGLDFLEIDLALKMFPHSLAGF